MAYLNWLPARLAAGMIAAGFVLTAGQTGCDRSGDAYSSGPSKATELTDANFAQRTAKGVALVDFWASWCGPCRRQAPIVEAIAEAYEGRALVGKLDVDANGKTAQAFGVRSIPTLIVLKDGKEVRRLVGLQQAAAVRQVLDAALGG